MSKVLVIENEANLQKLIRVNLTVRGYQVLVAADGENGLRLAQLEFPDLILLDLMLPGISGWDVLTDIKAMPHLERTKIIIMTAAAQEVQEGKAHVSGAVGYLTKPFGVDELLCQVKQGLKDDGKNESPLRRCR